MGTEFSAVCAEGAAGQKEAAGFREIPEPAAGNIIPWEGIDCLKKIDCMKMRFTGETADLHTKEAATANGP